MKARWDFYFESDVRFERAHEYLAKFSREDSREFGLPDEAFDALIDIDPDEKSRVPSAEQTGKLKITLPGNKDLTKDLAFWLARNVGQQITFTQGKFKVVYGLILGEL